MMTHQTVTFLVVEDDEIDIKALKRAFKELKLSNPIRFASDGIEALEILRGEGGNDKIEKPYLILLDLNMPRMNGIEFVNQIKRHAELKSIPVIIVSYKDKEEDRLAGLQAGANYYLTKSSFQDDSFIRAAVNLIGEA